MGKTKKPFKPGPILYSIERVSPMPGPTSGKLVKAKRLQKPKKKSRGARRERA